MIVYYLLLFCSALIFSSQFLITRQYQRRNGTGFMSSVKLSFYAYFAIALFFFVKGCIVAKHLNVGFSAFTFLLTFLVAVVSLLCVFMGIKVLAVGDMSIYSVFMMLGSLVLPTIAGIFFYDEKITGLKAAALLMMAAAIVCSVSAADKNKFTWKALLYYIGVFVMNGMIGVLFTIHQNHAELTAAAISSPDGYTVNNDVFMTWYGLSTVLLSGAIMVVYAVVKKIKSRKADRGQTELTAVTDSAQSAALKSGAMKAYAITVGLAALYGLCNGFGDYFIALATQPHALGASVTFPVINGGTILFSTLSGCLFFKEKIKAGTIVSLILVLASTILFMFV